MRRTDIPQFGPLQGVKVVHSSISIAGPFCAQLMADMGADVIWIENPKAPDIARGGGFHQGWSVELNRRNMRSMALDIPSEKGREVFLKMLADTDIFIEASKGGQYDRWGLSDEELWRANPALVIVHISGFGHREFGGVPEICARASYDMIGQAFSGYALYNGYPDRPPLMVAPAVSDYVTALFSLFGLLTAYMDAQKTGRGQVVDVAQFEAQAKIMREAFTKRSLGLGDIRRSGNKSTSAQPWDVYMSRDGRYMSMGAVGKAVYTRFLHAVGFDEARFPYEEAAATPEAINSPAGLELDAEITRWFSEHDADEIEETMRRARVPCSRINTVAECMEHPHFRSRDDFVTYTDQTLGREVCAFGVFPKLSVTPGRIWRGAPTLGQDTDEILRRILGRSEADIARLHAEGVV